jgi:hypothetical protein
VKQNYRFEMDDGETFDVSSDARDIRAWEAEYGKSYLSSPLSYTEIAQVAYIAAKRTGVLRDEYPSYKDFDAHCVEARGTRTEGRLIADPMPPEATDDSSAR